jgi:hypothetical protein
LGPENATDTHAEGTFPAGQAVGLIKSRFGSASGSPAKHTHRSSVEIEMFASVVTHNFAFGLKRSIASTSRCAFDAVGEQWPCRHWLKVAGRTFAKRHASCMDSPLACALASINSMIYLAIVIFIAGDRKKPLREG